MLTALWCLLADEHATALSISDSTGVKAQALRKQAVGAYKELQQGSYVSHLLRVVVAKVGL